MYNKGKRDKIDFNIQERTYRERTKYISHVNYSNQSSISFIQQKLFFQKGHQEAVKSLTALAMYPEKSN